MKKTGAGVGGIIRAGDFGTSPPKGRRRSNYQRLLEIKRRYDPDGLFTVHHGVGSEDWSADGFTRS
jgi:FAD/FMN-containing dehydrogenase